MIRLIPIVALAGVLGAGAKLAGDLSIDGAPRPESRVQREPPVPARPFSIISDASGARSRPLNTIAVSSSTGVATVLSVLNNPTGSQTLLAHCDNFPDNPEKDSPHEKGNQ